MLSKSLESATTIGKFGTKKLALIAFNLSIFLPAIVQLNSLETPYLFIKYSTTNFPVKPVLPHTIISNLL